MRMTKAAVVAGTVTALVMTVGAPARSAPAGTVFEDARQALASDLALTAKAMGWTLAQARAQHDAAERIGRVQEAVAARMPDAYVGGVLSERPGGAPTLLLKGPADAFVRQAVATAGVPIIVADRQPYSLRELQQRAKAVHRELAALGYRQIATAPDIATGRVSATVTARTGLPFSAASTTARLPGALRAGLDLTVQDGPVSSRESAVFGGMALTRTGLDRFVCTSGWSVTPGGFVGVTTAAHCNVNEAVHNSERHRLDLFDENVDPFIDVEWSTSPVPAPDDFYSNATTIRDVTAVEPLANITKGETVCVYGRSTNVRTCRVVLRASVSVTDSFGTSEQLIIMDQDVTQAGDSGGGWSFDTTAYGSHIGDVTFDGASRSAFFAADLFDEAIGVTVRT